MKHFRAFLFLFFALILLGTTSHAVFADVQHGSCECTVGESRKSDSISAPFSQIECEGNPVGSSFVDCEWSDSARQCLCHEMTVADQTSQSFAQASAPDQCTADLLQNQVAPDQKVVSCAWTGEDPELEKGQLFSATLRSDIKGLNKFGGKTVQQVIGTALKAVMGVMGTIALLVFIYGGLLWMTAQGNSDRQDRGLKTILWGALGVAVMLSSYALVNFVFEAFK